jgi:hypothetical protein
MAPLSLLGASFLEQSLDSGGSQEERCVPSYIDDGGFWRRSVMEARRRVRVVLHEQGGGTVWRVVASMASLVRGFTSV